MPTFTPRTTKEGMSSPSSPYNDIHYVGGLTTNHNSNKYNYNNAYTYQCTYYCLARLGEMSGEPVQTFSIAPNPNVKHRLFSRSGFGDGREWFNDTLWEKSSDKTKPKLGAVVCYAKYPNDGGGGRVSANNGSNPAIKYHNHSSADGVTSLTYTFDSYGKYRVCATVHAEVHNGNLVEFYTNGSIVSTHYSHMWSKGGGTYGGIGEAPLGTVLIFMGDITASGGQIVKILTKETQSFVTLFVERLP